MSEKHELFKHFNCASQKNSNQLVSSNPSEKIIISIYFDFKYKLEGMLSVCYGKLRATRGLWDYSYS